MQPACVVGTSCVNRLSLVPGPQCSKLDDVGAPMAHSDGFSGSVLGSSQGPEGESWVTMVGVTECATVWLLFPLVGILTFHLYRRVLVLGPKVSHNTCSCSSYQAAIGT
jgi:hypothetical protein